MGEVATIEDRGSTQASSDTRAGEVRPTSQRASVVAAAKYANPGDLCVVICVFNFGPNSEKRDNLIACRNRFRESGIPLVTVECAFGDDPWMTARESSVLHVRACTALWQKERLINLGLKLVPPRCTKVAWVDADILFENPGWAVTASERLDELAVVQLAEQFVRLPRGAQADDGTGARCESFAAVYRRNPNALLSGYFGHHGHTGFAWAARRAILEAEGLYDACIVGGADHLMAHAFCGDWDSPCLAQMMGARSPWRSHAAAWARKVYPLVRARLGLVEGTILHLWHGELSSRKHGYRYEPLLRFAFDPEHDIGLDDNGCWQWTSGKSELHAAVGDYLTGRRHEWGELSRSTEAKVVARRAAAKGTDGRVA